METVNSSSKLYRIEIIYNRLKVYFAEITTTKANFIFLLFIEQELPKNN